MNELLRSLLARGITGSIQAQAQQQLVAMQAIQNSQWGYAYGALLDQSPLIEATKARRYRACRSCGADAFDGEQCPYCGGWKRE